ncbi:MAG: hypothetical protein J5I59_06805 [Saprospiraceae bacterium]|nr:hypothetical protein [Saprospiraceae bacterium]
MKSWRFIRILICIAVIGMALRLEAQPYPVTVTINVTSPAGVSLPEYQVSSVPSIMATLILTDPEKPVFMVRLKLTIAGSGILLRTSDLAVLPPVELISGQPVMLDQNTLARYFDISTLEVSGMDRNVFIQRGQVLPEGTYSICLEAYDYHRPQGLPVSNTGCAVASLELYDPPILNPPDFANSVIFDQEPPVFQQGLFTWQPMHPMNIPVEYNLRIYKKEDVLPALPGKDILEYTPPYISIRTPALSYRLAPQDPPLMPDVQYFAVVQVVPQGYPAAFKNKGISQEVSFVINPEEEDPCEKPVEYKGAGIREGIALEWKMYRACEGYVTEYYDIADYALQYQDAEIDTGDRLADTIRQVLSDHEYVLRTGCICSRDTLYTDTIRIHYKRPKATVPPFACGMENGGIAGIQSYLPALHANDTIVAADIQVIISQASGSNGHFSGKGHIVVPYLKYARVNVTFTNIIVNDEYRMTDGELKVIGVGQNIIGDDILNAINDILEGMDDLSDLLGETAEILSMLDALLLEMADNMPPWLIQEILEIKGMIANPPEGADLAALQEKLKNLEGERKDWEMLYWNEIIEGVKYLDSVYQAQAEEIAAEYVGNSGSFEIIEFRDNESGEPDENGSNFKEINIEDSFEMSPEIEQAITEFSQAEDEYATLILIDKVEDELNIETVKDLLYVFKAVGMNVITLIGDEFRLRDWDMVVIEADTELVGIVSNIIKQSIIKTFHRL